MDKLPKGRVLLPHTVYSHLLKSTIKFCVYLPGFFFIKFTDCDEDSPVQPSLGALGSVFPRHVYRDEEGWRPGRVGSLTGGVPGHGDAGTDASCPDHSPSTFFHCHQKVGKI